MKPRDVPSGTAILVSAERRRYGQINISHKHKKEFYVFTLVSADVGTVVSAGSCASV